VRTRTLIPLLLALTALSAGCSQKHRLQIQSDTCWDGTINGEDHISDCGYVTYKILGPIRCAKVQKQTGIGFLRIRLDEQSWSETTEPMGLLQVCK